jgi:hypothetical protein
MELSILVHDLVLPDQSHAPYQIFEMNKPEQEGLVPLLSLRLGGTA